MRAPWMLGLLGACSFHEGYLPPDSDVADAAVSDGAQRSDARMVDAIPPDAPLSPCQLHATAKFGGGYYYATAGQSLSFLTAEDQCSQWGGRLVKISSSDENTFVRSTFTTSSTRTWIGLADPLDNNIYVWIDGAPLLFDYNAFPFGVPPISDGNCVDIGNNGKWGTADCSDDNHGGTCECD